MLEPHFFGLGLVNSVALIVIFVVRGRRLDLFERYGWLYLLLASRRPTDDRECVDAPP